MRFAYALAFIFSCARGPAESPSPVQEFSLYATDGTPVRLGDHLGRDVVLLAFFATWSKPSRAVLVHLEELHREKRALGFFIVGVAVDGPDTMADVTAFRARNDFTFPIVIDQDSSVTATYNPRRSVPFLVLVDRNGRTAQREGYNPGDESSIRTDVLRALSDPRGSP